MYQDPNASPFNALPRVVVILAAAIGLIELAFLAAENGLLAPRNMRILAVERFGFSVPLLERMIQLGTFPLEHILRFVTYVFVHVSFTSAIFALVFVLALGKYVGEVFEWWAVLVIFFGAAVFGALVFAGLAGPRLLYGAFPGAYGLIGAYTFILWVGLGAVGDNQLKAFTLIGFLLGLQLLFGLIFGSNRHWIAEVAGFLMGFALSTVVAPGGWQRLLAKIRERR